MLLVDSDYAGDLDKMRSLSKYVFTLENCVLVGSQHYKPQSLCLPQRQSI